MVEDDSSIVSNTKSTVSASETSDSGNSNYKHCRSKRARHDHVMPLARFKGVVPQQNGHWGAHIYAKHHRIWLGTFKSEREAAMAYDSASIKLRSGSGDMHRNLPWTDFSVRELDFQRLYSTEDVLNMIRDGSYHAKLEHFVKAMSRKDGNLITNLNKKLVHGDTQFSCMQLFQKELTPSDVGKLNRLVIPKKYAVKHFPPLGGGVEDIELVFYDKLMVRWKFRYWYWRSSQSFVFTRGWRRFVKEKKLGEKDTVTFYMCECSNGNENGGNFFLVDVNYSGESCCIDEGDKKRTNMLESPPGDGCGADDLAVELGLSLRGKNYTKTSSELNEDKEVDGFESGRNVKQKSVTLFGVQIN